MARGTCKLQSENYTKSQLCLCIKLHLTTSSHYNSSIIIHLPIILIQNTLKILNHQVEFWNPKKASSYIKTQRFFLGPICFLKQTNHYNDYNAQLFLEWFSDISFTIRVALNVVHSRATWKLHQHNAHFQVLLQFEEAEMKLNKNVY
jgi:hypothetical protein